MYLRKKKERKKKEGKKAFKIKGKADTFSSQRNMLLFIAQVVVARKDILYNRNSNS